MWYALENAKAKKPVIIMGRGAQWSNAGEACLKLGDRMTLVGDIFPVTIELHGLATSHGGRYEEMVPLLLSAPLRPGYARPAVNPPCSHARRKNPLARLLNTA